MGVMTSIQSQWPTYLPDFAAATARLRLILIHVLLAQGLLWLGRFVAFYAGAVGAAAGAAIGGLFRYVVTLSPVSLLGAYGCTLTVYPRHDWHVFLANARCPFATSTHTSWRLALPSCLQ